MKQEDFLNILKDQSKIDLIGPFFDPMKYKLDLSSPRLIVDGGCEKIKLNDQSKSLIVGDGDSSHQDMDVLLEEKKDFSDLSFALSLIPQNIVELSLFGFLGGRKDHEMINLGELHHFLNNREMKTKCLFDSHIQAFSKGVHQIKIEGVFSLIVLEKAKIHYLKGDCNYKIDSEQELLPLSSHGLSNIAQGEIEISSNKPFFIFLNQNL